MTNSLDLNFGVTDSIRAAGMRPGVSDAQHRIEPATMADGERLAVAAGTNLVIIDRVRTADDQPVVVSRDVFAQELLNGRDELLERMLTGSIYDILANDLGVEVDYGVANFRPIVAGSELATKLGVPSGELLVYLWQIDYTSEHTPVLLSHEYHLADAFEFSVIRRSQETRNT
jgi:GntR family transcriptional regulator